MAAASRRQTAAARFSVRSPKAIVDLLRAPGELGIGRAYVHGSSDARRPRRAMAMMFSWEPPVIDRRAQARLMLAAARGAGLTHAAARPAAELSPKGARHSKERDARAVRHHYDLSNEFFGLFLDRSMTYSCAIFSRGAEHARGRPGGKARHGLPQARARRGRPGPRRRMWVGELRDPRRKRLRRAGASGSPFPRLRPSSPANAPPRLGWPIRSSSGSWTTASWPESASTRSPASGWSSTSARSGSTSTRDGSRSCCEPGGRLLNHGISRARHGGPRAGPFSDRYVFPDGETLHSRRSSWRWSGPVSRPSTSRASARTMRETLSDWIERLDREPRARAEQLAGPERLRVWRLYLRAARNGFLTRFTSIYQVKCLLPAA